VRQETFIKKYWDSCLKNSVYSFAKIVKIYNVPDTVYSLFLPTKVILYLYETSLNLTGKTNELIIIMYYKHKGKYSKDFLKWFEVPNFILWNYGTPWRTCVIWIETWRMSKLSKGRQGWKHCSSGKEPGLQKQSPEFKPITVKRKGG
jgi:hypothetical protein